MKTIIFTLLTAVCLSAPAQSSQLGGPIIIWPTEHIEGTWTTTARDHQYSIFFRKDHEVMHSFFFKMIDNYTGQIVFEGRMNATQYGMMGSFKSETSNIHTALLYTDAEGTHLRIFIKGSPRLEFFLVKTDQI